MYSIYPLRSFTSALSHKFLYVTCIMEFPLGVPDSCIIWVTPPSYIIGDRGTTVLNLGEKKIGFFLTLQETKFL